MEAPPSREKKSTPDQDSGGDRTTIPSDNTHACPTQQTEMVPKETQVDLEKVKPGKYDPFGQIFAGPKYTKLPTPDLLRVQADQLQIVRDLGYNPPIAGAGAGKYHDPALPGPGSGFSSAAVLSLMEFGINIPGPETEWTFFDHALSRLVEAAEESSGLYEFIHTLVPNISFGETSGAVYYDGTILMYPGRPTPIPVATLVDFFISGANNEWTRAKKEAARWENQEEET